jgi:protein-disulfide isomerase
VKYRSRSNKINKRALTLGIVLAVVIIGGSATAFLSMGQNNSNRAGNTNQANELIRLLVQPVSQNASALGNDGAKITIVEFGDYQCQSCAQFHKGVRNELIQRYVNTGIAKFVFKDFVIIDKPFDKASTLAARASYCAGDQGKYWGYHDEVYNNSKGENTGWITKSSLVDFARDVQVPDLTKFSTCLDSKKHSEVVFENDGLAKSLGLKSTPTFILVSAGKQPLGIIGAQPFNVFQQAIAELEKE